jgi:hypothetical protein
MYPILTAPAGRREAIRRRGVSNRKPLTSPHRISPHLTSLHSLSRGLNAVCCVLCVVRLSHMHVAGGWWWWWRASVCDDQLSDDSDPASSAQVRLEFLVSEVYRCFAPHLQSMPAHMYREVMRLPL